MASSEGASKGERGKKVPAELQALYDEAFDWFLVGDPVVATMIGSHQYNHMLKDYSHEGKTPLIYLESVWLVGLFLKTRKYVTLELIPITQATRSGTSSWRV
tara:strand:- start:279 stop:584 length:306 start_codon:yes stop_codon:yes gene_type:complete